MNYDKYKNRMLKIRKVRDFLYRFRVLIISILVLILATTSTLLGITGYVYQKDKLENIYTYGEHFEPNASGIFKDVCYEYSALGTNEWKKAPPEKVGKYEYRTVSLNCFNKPIYGKELQFEIVPKEVDIDVFQSSLKYGEKFSVVPPKLEYSDSLTKFEVQLEDYALQNTKAYAVLDSLEVLNSKKEDVTNCYKFNINKKDVTITPVDLSIHFDGGTKIYDGTAIKNSDYQLLQDNLKYGDKIVLSDSKEQVEVGNVENLRDVKIINSENKDVSYFYNLNLKADDLVVFKRPLSIKTNSAIKEYDGKPFNLTYETTEGTLLSTHHIDIKYLNSDISTLGNYTNSCELHILNEQNENVDKYYELNIIPGTLTINPRFLKIKSVSDNKIYDETPLSNNNFEILEGSLLLNHELIVLSSTEIQNCGKIDNFLEYVIEDKETKENVNQFYNLSFINGSLEVRKKDATVTVKKISKMYDGTPLLGNQYEIEGLLEGHKSLASNYSVETKVGTYNNDKINIQILNKDDLDVTSNYNITYLNTENSLEITQKPLKLKSKSKSKEYDGDYIYANDVDFLDGTSKADTDTIEYIRYETFKNIAKKSNVIEIKILNEYREDVTSCYDIDLTFGELEITKSEIEVYVSHPYFEYTGEPINEIVNLSSDKHLGNLSITGRLISDQIEIGTGVYHIEPGSIVIRDMTTDNIVTENFLIIAPDRTINISKKQICLRPIDIIVEYEGHPIKATEWSIYSGGLLPNMNHSIVCDVVGELDSPLNGPKNSTIENAKIVDEYGNDVSYLYEIALLEGRLKFYKQKLILSSKTFIKKFDGTPLNYSQEAYIKSGQLLEGHKIEFEFDKKEQIINVDQSLTLAFNYKIFDLEGNDVSDTYYDVTEEYGNCSITPENIELGFLNKSKIYDGKENKLGSPEYIEITSESRPVYIKRGKLYQGARLMGLSYASGIVPGKYQSLFNWKLLDNTGIEIQNSETLLYGNYEIHYREYELPTLEIVKRSLKIEAASGRKVFDGKPFENEIRINSGRLIKGHHIEYRLDEFTKIGTYFNIIHDFRILDEEGNEVTQYYNVELITGNIEIVKNNQEGVYE